MWRSDAVVLPNVLMVGGQPILLVPLDPEYEDNTVLRNFANYSPSDTAPHPRRLESSAAPL
jgi:hypothetical protein